MKGFLPNLCTCLRFIFLPVPILTNNVLKNALLKIATMRGLPLTAEGSMYYVIFALVPSLFFKPVKSTCS